MLSQMKQHARAFSNEVSTEVGKSWMGIGKNMVGGIVGAISFEGVKSFVGGIFEHAHGIKELSEQFDISTDSVQRWQKALTNAGVSETVLFRSMEAFRAKREAALGGDQGALDDFRMAGIGREKLSTGNEEDLFNEARLSDASRPTKRRLGINPKLSEIKLGGQGVLSESDIEDLEMVRNSWRKTTSGITNFFTKIGLIAAQDTANQLTNAKNILKVAFSWNKPAAIAKIMKDSKRDAENKRLAAEYDKRVAADQKAKEVAEEKQIREQAEQAKAYKDSEQARLKQQNEADELRGAKRKNMMPRAARADERKELSEVEARLKTIKSFIGPLSPEKQEELHHLEMQREGLKADLREKPMEVQADSMAKIGLFGSSGTTYNPLLGINNQQLQRLDRIAQGVDALRRNNPFAQ